MTLFEHLLSYSKKNRISFAMPGHKGGAGLMTELKNNIAKIDVTELSDTENLHAPKSVIRQAKAMLSRIYQSDESWLLTGGSTEGVHIMLYSAVKNGKLLVNRATHRSAVNGAVLAGIDIEYVEQELDEGLNTPMPPTAEKIEELLKSTSDIDACMITSPDYYGHIADVEAIAKVCHSYAIPLLVDEAHGAHLERGAIKCGADMAVQSAHKTLNALNQSAFLHLKSDIIERDMVAALTAMIATSSPSYPIAASGELAARELDGNGWAELCEYIKGKKAELKSSTSIIYPSGLTDEARIVFGFANYDITGYEAEKQLRDKYNIDVEMSDRFNVVCIATPANTHAEIDTLFSAVGELLSAHKLCVKKTVSLPDVPKKAMTPREAFRARGERIKLGFAEGRIAKTNISAYPPGIAICCYGEIITKEIIDYIIHIKELGAEVEGIDDYVTVVAR